MSRIRLVTIALLIVGAGLFALGTSIEKGRHHDPSVEGVATADTHVESGETATEHAAEGSTAHTESSASEEGRILGVDREATGIVILAVLVSLGLALLLWQRPSRAVWFGVGIVATGFAVFDLVEVIHQLGDSANGLAVLAAAVGLAHAGTAGLAVTAVTTSRSS